MTVAVPYEKDIKKSLNVEIKARYHDHDSARRFLQERQARFVGLDHQVDTYFNCFFGRLKLREGDIENHLIHYAREETQGPKESKVLLYQSTPGSTLKDILTRANGVLAVVDKQREIYFLENVKFHLDTVDGLGKFLEIEALDRHLTIGRERLLEQCRSYQGLLGIADEDLLACSYSDMVLAAAQRP